MARGGIYKSEVMRARDNLLAMGRYPSIDAIRHELGDTGSKGTIHRYLKEIEEEEGGKAGQQVAVSEAIQDLSLRLAERLHLEADGRINALVEKHKSETGELGNLIAALRNEVESFRAQVERQALDLAAEKAAHAQTLATLQAQSITNAQQTQRIQDMESQLATEATHRQSLEEKHLHARESLEHFRLATKEQREQEQRQFEQQIQFLQSEIRSTKESLNGRQQELIHSHTANAKLSSELAHARREQHRLEGEARLVQQAREQLASVEQRNQQLSVKLAQAMEQSASLVQENQDIAGRLQNAQVTVRELETELVAVNARLGAHEQILQGLKLVPLSDMGSDTKTDGGSF